jgi:branched-chain amino acid aminotransferase
MFSNNFLKRISKNIQFQFISSKSYNDSILFLTLVNSNQLVVNESHSKVEKPDYNKPLPWGVLRTDYMLEVDWDEELGWNKPVINPFHNLEIDPRNSTLHYAIQLFEGMKAYRNKDTISLFRPDMNMKRLITSAERIGLPVSLF